MPIELINRFSHKHEVYTLGYEGRSIDEFVQVLKEHKIKFLIDVRYTPLSRKRCFSKTPLKRILNQNGIEMVSLPEVGTPKEFRDFLKKTGNYQMFFKMYSGYIRKNKLFDKLRPHINGERVCLMCFERNPYMCHRHILTEMIENDMQAKIVHLYS